MFRSSKRMMAKLGTFKKIKCFTNIERYKPRNKTTNLLDLKNKKFKKMQYRYDKRKSLDLATIGSTPQFENIIF